MTEKASCAECPSVFEPIPPADKSYSVPKEKSTSNDFIKRIYECEDQGHRNTIYWEKKDISHVGGQVNDKSDIDYGMGHS